MYYNKVSYFFTRIATPPKKFCKTWERLENRKKFYSNKSSSK